MLVPVLLAVIVALAGAVGFGLVQRRRVAERLAALERLVAGSGAEASQAVAPLVLDEASTPEGPQPLSSLRPSERVERLTAVVRDELRRGAEAAALSGQLARAIDALSQGVVVVDADRRPLLANSAGRAMLSGRHGMALVAAATVACLDDALAEGIAHREVDVYGPPQRWFRITGRSFGDDRDTDISGEAGAVAVIDEVTEEVRTDRLRRDFVANVSHELKTPIGALAVLAETAALADEASRDDLLKRLEGEARRVSATVDDLLELARTESGSSDRAVLVDVDGTLDEIVETVRRNESRRVAIQRGVASGARITGDPRELQAAVRNLVENAVRHSEPGGSVQVNAEVRSGRVVIEVVDHGEGIPARDLDRVFERFYRVDASRGRDTGGTGLGLSIVRHAVENLDGRVTVRSRQGAGATFTIDLPLTSLADETDVARAM